MTLPSVASISISARPQLQTAMDSSSPIRQYACEIIQDNVITAIMGELSSIRHQGIDCMTQMVRHERMLVDISHQQTELMALSIREEVHRPHESVRRHPAHHILCQDLHHLKHLSQHHRNFEASEAPSPCSFSTHKNSTVEVQSPNETETPSKPFLALQNTASDAENVSAYGDQEDLQSMVIKTKSDVVRDGGSSFQTDFLCRSSSCVSSTMTSPMDFRKSVRSCISATGVSRNSRRSQNSSRASLKERSKILESALFAGQSSNDLCAQLVNEDKHIIFRIGSHPYFEWCSAVIILTHAALIGLAVQFYAIDGSLPETLAQMNSFLVAVFLCEVGLKALAERVDFLRGSERYWNWFDLSLVFLVAVEIPILASGWKIGKKKMKLFLKVGEMVRTVRVLRIFRLLRFSSTLSMIIGKIAFSLKSLGWLCMLIFIELYVCAVCFTQMSNTHLDGRQHDGVELYGHQQGLIRKFGSVPISFRTLFESISGGVIWAEISFILGEASFAHAIFFEIFVVMNAFFVVSLITGIVVDACIESCTHQRDVKDQQQQKVREAQVAELRHIFEEMDTGNTGTICLNEFGLLITAEPAASYLRALDIHNDELCEVFGMLDVDDSNSIYVDEFIDGMMRLKGEARSIDVHRLIVTVTKLVGLTEELVESLITFNGDADEFHATIA